MTIFLTARQTLFLIISNEHLRLDIFSSQGLFLELSSVIRGLTIGQGNMKSHTQGIDLDKKTNSKISNVSFKIF